MQVYRLNIILSILEHILFKYANVVSLLGTFMIYIKLINQYLVLVTLKYPINNKKPINNLP